MTTTTTETSPATATAAPERIRYITPAVTIHEDADGYTIEAEMPGVGKDGVHVTVENGELVFTGAKSAPPAGNTLYRETSRADYRRVFDLDPAVDTDQISARMDQGVLVLRLPKAQDKKPRRITIGD
ncbi:MAG: Hsp20/alpha crystallin family protein [Chthoniobacterales bacterium]